MLIKIINILVNKEYVKKNRVNFNSIQSRLNSVLLKYKFTKIK